MRLQKTMLFMLALLLMPAVVYSAPDRVGKWDGGLNVSGVIPSEGDYVDDSMYFGGTLAYGVTNWFAVGVESGYTSIGTGFDVSGVSINLGDLRAIPVFADFILRMPAKPEQAAVPYALVGAGAIFWDFDSAISGLSINVDTSFAAKVGGGLDWFVSDNAAVNFEASYVFSNADATVTGAGVTASAGDINTDYWQIGGGIKFLFG